MSDEDATIKGPVIDVREFGGRRLFKAERLSSGNWLLVEFNGASRRTINHDEFLKGYERISADDRQIRPGPGV